MTIKELHCWKFLSTVSQLQNSCLYPLVSIWSTHTNFENLMLRSWDIVSFLWSTFNYIHQLTYLISHKPEIGNKTVNNEYWIFQQYKADHNAWQETARGQPGAKTYEQIRFSMYSSLTEFKILAMKHKYRFEWQNTFLEKIHSKIAVYGQFIAMIEMWAENRKKASNCLNISFHNYVIKKTSLLQTKIKSEN